VRVVRCYWMMRVWARVRLLQAIALFELEFVDRLVFSTFQAVPAQRGMSCFRSAPVARIVVMSYGGDFGTPPKHALGFVSVKNLTNPPAALRRHNGTNEDLRRFVVESPGAAAKIEQVTATFRALLSVAFERRAERERAVLGVYWCLRQTLCDRACCLLVCDQLFEEEEEEEELLLCVGCVAGQHRSVSVAEHLVRTGALRGVSSVCPHTVQTRHRELEDRRVAARGRGKRNDTRRR
jgi:hypothetical protein